MKSESYKGLEWRPETREEYASLSCEAGYAILLREKTGRFRIEVNRRDVRVDPFAVEHAPNADKARARAAEILLSLLPASVSG